MHTAKTGKHHKTNIQKILFLLQGRTGSHTKSEIFNHNISDQPRISKSEIFNLKYFTSHQAYSIQLKQCTSPDNPPSFPHGSQWASERLVLTYAYLLTGTQRVKRYIPHPRIPNHRDTEGEAVHPAPPPLLNSEISQCLRVGGWDKNFELTCEP